MYLLFSKMDAPIATFSVARGPLRLILYSIALAAKLKVSVQHDKTVFWGFLEWDAIIA